MGGSQDQNPPEGSSPDLSVTTTGHDAAVEVARMWNQEKTRKEGSEGRIPHESVDFTAQFITSPGIPETRSESGAHRLP